MIKKVLVLLVISIILQVNIPVVSAQTCDKNNDTCDHSKNLFCLPFCAVVDGKNDCSQYGCQVDDFKGNFGNIQAPAALKGLIDKNPSGAGGLGIFFSNLVALFYVIAAIVLIFMLLWGAFDWITSEGDKEKVASARNKIINALIGIMLFAAAFAVIKVLGQFTGFQFFVGQDTP